MISFSTYKFIILSECMVYHYMSCNLFYIETMTTIDRPCDVDLGTSYYNDKPTI